MITRQIKKKHWEEVCEYIRTNGKVAPLTVQFDVDVYGNGITYTLKLQLGRKCKVTALQAVGVSQKENGETTYTVIEDGALLSALLQILICQQKVYIS